MKPVLLFHEDLNMETASGCLELDVAREHQLHRVGRAIWSPARADSCELDLLARLAGGHVLRRQRAYQLQEGLLEYADVRADA